MAPVSDDQKCPCGSGKRFGDCCGPLLKGAPASDARALMRSRYTAFALEDRDYLLKSWHSSTRPQQLELDAVNWLGLKIEAYMPLTSTLARVKFVAKGKDASGQLFKLKENSRFVKEHGHWYYVDGKIS